MKKIAASLSFLLMAMMARPQAVQKPAAPAVYRDTVYNLAVDSLRHNMGRVSIRYRRLIKTFKYVGGEPAIIVRPWTGDPHFICEYPTVPLMPGREYQFTVCFSFGGGGRFQKQMGFILQDEKIITFTFTGEVVPEGQLK